MKTTLTGGANTSWIDMKLRELAKADNKTLRNYGLTMAVPIVIIAAILLWKGKASAPYFFGLAVLFALLGLALPRILKPLYVAWMALAFVLSVVMTYVILTVFFYLIMTPAGLILRILGKDLLSRKFPGGKESYWVAAHRYDDEIERYSKPY